MVNQFKYSLIVFSKIFISVIALLFFSQADARCQNNDFEKIVSCFQNIALFTEWEETDIAANQEFVITVIGENPFGSFLNDYYFAKKINNRKVKIQFITSVDQIENTHILYISDSEFEKVDLIINNIKNKSILTIASDRRFIKKGVIVCFCSQSKNEGLPFVVNQTELRNARLRMSHLLLKEITIVEPIKR